MRDRRNLSRMAQYLVYTAHPMLSANGNVCWFRKARRAHRHYPEPVIPGDENVRVSWGIDYVLLQKKNCYDQIAMSNIWFQQPILDLTWLLFSFDFNLSNYGPSNSLFVAEKNQEIC